jgi:hypothetical protein
MRKTAFSKFSLVVATDTAISLVSRKPATIASTCELTARDVDSFGKAKAE